jgi:hypothetical protein
VCFPGPGAEVAGFESFDAAEADRTLREAAVRLKMNPFECGPLPAVTTLPDPILRDFLMDAGVEPPAAGVPWADWWTATRATMSDEHQVRVWRAADKVRFFEVTEEPDGPQVHVVVDVTWEERAGVHVAEWDGGELIRACRSLKRAGEIARGRATQRRITLAGQHAVDAAPFADCRPSHVPDPFAPGSTHLLRLPRASFSEVVSIPFEDTDDPRAISGDRVSVVVRHDHAAGQFGFRTTSGDAGVPVGAFTDWEVARGEAREREREARSWFNPFRISATFAGQMSEESRELEALCRTVGVVFPCDGEAECWWSEGVAVLPEAKRDIIWDWLGVRFYSVVSVPFDS